MPNVDNKTKKEPWAVIVPFRVAEVARYLNKPYKEVLTTCFAKSRAGWKSGLQAWLDEIGFKNWQVEPQDDAWLIANMAPPKSDVVSAVSQELFGFDQARVDAFKKASKDLAYAVKSEIAAQEERNAFVEELAGLEVRKNDVLDQLHKRERVYKPTAQALIDEDKALRPTHYAEKCVEFGGEDKFFRAVWAELVRRENPDLLDELETIQKNIEITSRRKGEAQNELEECIKTRVAAEKKANAAKKALDQ